MKCPYCGCEDSKVIDSRPTDEKAVTDIEAQLQNSLEKEITSGKIGELAMEKLKDIDEVAYVRFASVYRQFKDVSTFVDEVTKLLNEK